MDESLSYPGQSMLNMSAGGLRRSLSALVTIHSQSVPIILVTVYNAFVLFPTSLTAVWFGIVVPRQ